MECWGAQGGGYSTTLGGKGAYCSGILSITQTTSIYIYILVAVDVLLQMQILLISLMEGDLRNIK